mmetsp:Transcript_5109/g.9992  ORF Transcript_5109/g.9992 Transcript_5109/m.9992 type:complete len:120 (+) Transcript_5109:54-413(+)|eukprot:CAMPEP_0119058150 /NCGR_PEP_ID=MMETSP1178-20130426/2515_1 /TAXON_ID=33656 /ORGANISM="unid sp, Strain CCMP2000" /LENGTH=119 /DNA_ID=CAMNT_0007039053 /DNA_START=54 /DNA_END=413 /DNA_ORIENTATION=-
MRRSRSCMESTPSSHSALEADEREDERRMAILSYAERGGVHEILCSATPEGLQVKATGKGDSGLFAKRSFRRGELLYKGEAMMLANKPGTILMHYASGGSVSFDVVTHCVLDGTCFTLL